MTAAVCHFLDNSFSFHVINQTRSRETKITDQFLKKFPLCENSCSLWASKSRRHTIIIIIITSSLLQILLLFSLDHNPLNIYIREWSGAESENTGRRKWRRQKEESLVMLKCDETTRLLTSALYTTTNLTFSEESQCLDSGHQYGSPFIPFEEGKKKNPPT